MRNKEPHGQIVTLKYHFPLKEIKSLITYRSGAEKVPVSLEYVLRPDSKYIIKDY